MGPLVALFLGVWISKRVKALEHRQWGNQKLTEKRMAIFDETAIDLNGLYCYFCRVGNWNELTPEDIIGRKRNLDKKIHVNMALFSESFHDTYQAFMSSCFQTFSGTQRDARLRTVSDYRGTLPNWDNKWSDRFCGDSDPQLGANYFALMKEFAAELADGLHGRN